MARSVLDLAIMLDVMAGYHPDDPVSSRAPVSRYADAVRHHRSRPSIGWSADFGMGVCEGDIADGLGAAARVLSDAGRQVRGAEFRLDGRHPFLIMFDLIAGASYGRLERHAIDSFDALCSYSQAFLEVGKALSAAAFTRAVYEAKQLRHQLDKVLDEHDVLMLPVTAVVAWPHDTPPATVQGKPPAEFGGIAYGGLPYLALASITGHPAMTVPVGLDASGMPLAVQLIGRWFDEAALLQVAATIEEAFPFARPEL